MNNEILMARSKNYTNQVALGISNMRTSGTTVYFTVAATGEEVSVTLPVPADGKDGISVTGVSDKGNGVFTLLLSDGSETERIHTLQGIKGEKGDPGVNGNDGITPNLTIGTVETLDAGTSATASITGDKENPVLNLGIPKGADGKDGAGTSGSTVDVLEGKKILFIGDSICEGVGANGKPYPYWIQQNHPNANVINLGVGGMTISKKDNTVTNCMPQRIQNGEFDNEDYSNPDIILFEGGVNDMMRNIKLGEITNSYSAGKNVRFCDALEYMFKYFKNKFPSARMIFTSIHRLSSMDVNLQNAWWELTSEICSKWGVEYIDLYSLVNANVITGLDLHPDENVHRKYYAPIIDNILCGARTFASGKTDFYLKNRVATIFYHSGTKTFNVGDNISTSDWRINGYRADLTTYINATSGCSFDISDVDNTQVGNYPVHVSYVDNGRVLYCDVIVTVSEPAEKVLDSISAIKTKTSYSVNDVLNLDDVTVTAHYSDSSTANVTANATISGANVDMNNEGTYYIDISYIENLITKTTQIAVSVTAEPQPEPEPSTWDDETTVTRAWGTTTNEGVFVNTNIAELTKDVSYNVNCELVCDHDGAIRLRIGGISSSDYTCVANQPIQISYVMNYTNPTVRNHNPQVYTVNGSGFPWTVKIKDFAIS